MKERPINMTGPEVRAILAGQKTQIRRLISARGFEPYEGDEDNDGWPVACVTKTGCLARLPCPYSKSGDRLWVRETHAIWTRVDDDPGEPRRGVYYAAGERDEKRRSGWRYPSLHVVGKWSPSIHMPRWASRIALEVTEVRVQRLQDIGEEDVRAEGLIQVTKDGVTWKWACPTETGSPAPMTTACLGPTGQPIRVRHSLWRGIATTASERHGRAIHGSGSLTSQ